MARFFFLGRLLLSKIEIKIFCFHRNKISVEEKSAIITEIA